MLISASACILAIDRVTIRATFLILQRHQISLFCTAPSNHPSPQKARNEKKEAGASEAGQRPFGLKENKGVNTAAAGLHLSSYVSIKEQTVKGREKAKVSIDFYDILQSNTLLICKASSHRHETKLVSNHWVNFLDKSHIRHQDREQWKKSASTEHRHTWG